MKKIFIYLLLAMFTMSSTIVNVKGKNKNIWSQINVDTITVSDYIVAYETNSGIKCIYNVNTGFFEIKGKGSAVITTEVVEIYDNSLSEDEYLELDKKATLNAFIALKNDTVLSRSYSSTGIPEDAEYDVALTYRKNIGQIVGELGEVIEIIGQATSILASCPPIPQAELLEVVGLAVQASGVGLQALSASLTSDWTYSLHKTKIMYKVGITTQYGYRYAQAGIIMKGRIDGEYYDAISYLSDIVGGWWVSQKPF